MKIAIVLGTRPEIIKLSYIIKQLEREKADFFIIHTGQHYDHNLDKIFFDDLDIEMPKYNLDSGSGTHAEELASTIIPTEQILIKEKPDFVIVQGDTNSTLTGALAAAKLELKVVHVEAGMRSNEKKMPEEINRIIVDHISDILLPPTKRAVSDLALEGLIKNVVFTGNMLTDIVNDAKKIAHGKFSAPVDPYFLLTTHRPKNVDDESKLRQLIYKLSDLADLYKFKIMFPIHPRTKKSIDKFNIELPDNIVALVPLSYFEFLVYEENAKVIITDSGGVQMEACILNTPCVTLRDVTEWTETLEVGANILVTPQEIIHGVKLMIDRKDWPNPYSGSKINIVKCLEEFL